MPKIPLNIVEFFEHPQLIADQSLSMAQKACLKSIYGLPLEVEEFELYKRATGRQAYDVTEQREATILSGRRGGKTTKIAARIAIYEALRDHGLPKGEEGCVMLLAPTLKQARIAFRAIRKDLRSSMWMKLNFPRYTGIGSCQTIDSKWLTRQPQHRPLGKYESKREIQVTGGDK